jgi:hypothetical protein
MRADDLQIITFRESNNRYVKEIKHKPTGLTVKGNYPSILSDTSALTKELEQLLEANHVRTNPTNYSKP